MWWLLASGLYYGIILLLIVQLVRLFLADGDLTLLFKEKFGASPADLRGKVVWVTGASSGLGEALVYQLAAAGCKLILSARRRDQLTRVQKQCLVSGPVTEDNIMVLPFDLLDISQHSLMAEQVLQKFGHLDILVNNGARSQRAWIKETSLEVDREMFELCVVAQISLTKAVLPHFIERQSGHVVITSSIAGKVGAPFSATYTACKHALQGYFEAFRLELAADNIDVTLVCPGPVFSKILENAFTGTSGEVHAVPQASSDRRMLPERFAELMVVAIANKLGEAWISRHPVLLFTYIVQYMPDTARWFGKRLGVKIATRARDGK